MGSILRTIPNEMYKSLLHLWSYKYNTLAEIVQRGIGFLALGFILGQGRINSAQMAFVLPGWIVSFYGRIILRQVNEAISEEARTGTLEQMYMSPVSSAWLLVGRVLAVLSVATLQVVVLMTVLILLTGIRLPLRWEVLPITALTLAGLFGFSFLLDGVALLIKSISSLIDLTQDLLLLINGTAVAVSLLPIWLQTFSLALPTTYGIIVIRHVLLDGRSFASLWSDGSIMILTLHSAAYIAVGWLVYQWCERVAKRQGSLGRY